MERGGGQAAPSAVALASPSGRADPAALFSYLRGQGLNDAQAAAKVFDVDAEGVWVAFY